MLENFNTVENSNIKDSNINENSNADIISSIEKESSNEESNISSGMEKEPLSEIQNMVPLKRNFSINVDFNLLNVKILLLILQNSL